MSAEHRPWGPEPGDTIRCWCGELGTYDELFDDEFLDASCGGMGVLYCSCGGDLCICHNHGEVECPGCADCSEDDEFDDWTEDDDWDGVGP